MTLAEMANNCGGKGGKPGPCSSGDHGAMAIAGTHLAHASTAKAFKTGLAADHMKATMDHASAAMHHARAGDTTMVAHHNDNVKLHLKLS